MRATSLTMTGLSTGQLTQSFIPHRYPGHLSTADLSGSYGVYTLGSQPLASSVLLDGFSEGRA